MLAIMDWHSRFVIDFVVSNTLESTVFIETREKKFRKRKAENLQFGSRKSIYGDRMAESVGRKCASKSVWTDEADVLTIYLSKDYGEPSNKKKYI